MSYLEILGKLLVTIGIAAIPMWLIMRVLSQRDKNRGEPGRILSHTFTDIRPSGDPLTHDEFVDLAKNYNISTMELFKICKARGFAKNEEKVEEKLVSLPRAIIEDAVVDPEKITAPNAVETPNIVTPTLPKPTHKFNVGDFVRSKNTGNIYKIEEKKIIGEETASYRYSCHPSAKTTNGTLVNDFYPSKIFNVVNGERPDDYLEIARPREGEWWTHNPGCNFAPNKHKQMFIYEPWLSSWDKTDTWHISNGCVTPVNFGKG